MRDQVRVLIGIFVVLMALVAIKSNRDRKINFLQSHPPHFFKFKMDDVQSFQINHFISGIFFQRKDGLWQVKHVKNELALQIEAKGEGGFAEEDSDFKPADSTEVAKVLTYLCELRGLSPVATGGDVSKIFEINLHSLHVIFFDKDGKELDRLFIGKDGADHYSSYIKRPDSNQIYLAEQNFRLLLQRNFEEWLPK